MQIQREKEKLYLYGSIWCCISTKMLSSAVSVSFNKNQQKKGNSSLFTLYSFRFCNSIYTRFRTMNDGNNWRWERKRHNAHLKLQNL
ncbi:hypothetical protein CMV_009134 [Castanea mollissima]|uniref:Uncharacterized protein n=1 Tax=Castanea mollissima TaxID=60419 RepID=A0A8J4RPP7_9ROSI|nr:hypothetical protein CMV_009134 [Castanea mollissima]